MSIATADDVDRRYPTFPEHGRVRCPFTALICSRLIGAKLEKPKPAPA